MSQNASVENPDAISSHGTFETFAELIGGYFDNFADTVNNNINTLTAIVSQETYTTPRIGCKRTASSRAKADEGENADVDRCKHRKSSISPEEENEDKSEDANISIPDQNEMNDKLRELINESSNNEDSSGEEEEVFKSFSKMIDTKEVVSAHIESKLAEIVNQLWQQPLQIEKMKDKIPQYNRPKNCQSLIVKKCNPEVWSNHLQTKHRATDFKFQKIQSANVKSAIIFTQLADKLVNLRHNRDLSQKEVRLALSALINMCSDQNRRNYLPADLAPLAKDVPDNSDLLFGDNRITRIIGEHFSFRLLKL